MRKRRFGYWILSMLITFCLPGAAWADTIPSSDSSTDAPAPANTSQSTSSQTSVSSGSSTNSKDKSTGPKSTTGPTSPTGAGANTYTYNPSTGLWENQYYTWNPTTHQTAPKTAQNYSYNPSTGMWDTTKWVYDAPSGKYVPNVIASPNNPQAVAGTQATPDSTTSSTGPNSGNVTDISNNNNGVFDLFYNASISNTINQSANSGSATVVGNTVAGSALTGNALDVTNIINTLESSFGLQDAANLLTFTENINGDVNGDITIDPSQINDSSLAVDNSNTQNNLTVNSGDSGLINNNLTLGATSGNAKVADNSNVGNATSGNADAVANIVNVLNSAIAANQSFLGVVNINGNLNGDILLPPGFLDQLLASNAPRANVSISNSGTTNVTANTQNNENIVNDINLAAKSGTADVSDNTNAGNATTGNATTNLTIFNLTGQQIVAKNSLLVFVNVLGKWVGLIMNAPVGTSAAAVGGGVTKDSSTVANNAKLNQDTNNTIANNIKVNSTSGNATVTDNTNAGNATTGNATASANIANLIDSQLSDSGWFGMLFINVFGTWFGSFGVNTAAGNSVASSASGGQTPVHAAVFGFIPKFTKGGTGSSGSYNYTRVGSNAGNNNHTVILASTENNGGFSSGSGASIRSAAPKEQVPSASSHSNGWILPVASFALVMLVTGSLGTTGELSDKIHARLLSYRLGRS